MNTPDFFIFDFDNTMIQGESLDILAKISLKGSSDRDETLRRIKDLTDQAMAGQLDFGLALKQRLLLLNLNETHIKKAIEHIKTCISKSFLSHRLFLKKNAHKIYIVSGGFKEIIVPVAEFLGLDVDKVFANEFLFNWDRKVLGVDPSNPLSQNRGKAHLVRSLKLKGKGWALGDGMTDYEIGEDNANCQFYAYTENIEREEVLKKTHINMKSLEALVGVLEQSTSKSPMPIVKALLLENVHQVALQILQSRGWNVEMVNRALNEEELLEKIQDVHFLGLRSKTKIQENILEKAPDLLSVGAFCIGTDQIDLETSTIKGVPVFNAPYSSTRSVVELASGLIIMLCRQIFPKSSKLHQGVWDKSVTGSSEVRGKTLGIIGYGNIGSQLSVLAESMGLYVIYYDIEEKISLGNAHRTKDLKYLLSRSDIVTLHIDGRDENRQFFTDSKFQEMKDGAFFINLSRGNVVDIQSLAKQLKSGKLAGAAVDVYPLEPHSNKEAFVSELQNLSNVILTPHIGGSTLEAQKNIAETVAQRFLDFYEKGSTKGAVNFPQLDIPEVHPDHRRIIHIHENVPGILASVNSFLSKWNINVEAQYLGTQDDIGYLVTDVSLFKEEFLKDLESMPHTIKVRVF